MRALWLASVLRTAGLNVVTLPGWEQRGSEFGDLRAVVWHHDGSPPGASPSVPAYMAGQIDQDEPGAQTWVALDGTWHVIASGKVSHAGRTLPGKPGNSTSIGVESDHTTGEKWSGVHLLESLRRGTAAILHHLDVTPDRGLEFHKTICSPVGRKTDPDGLDLAVERRAVANIGTPPPAEDDTMDRTCIPSWLPRQPNGRVGFYRLHQDTQGWLVLAYNGAPLLRTDGHAFVVPFMRLPKLNAPPVGIETTGGGQVVVVAEDGGVFDIAKGPD